MKKHKRFQRTAAFTMIEVVVTIVVIAILAAITTVVYLGIRENAKQASNLVAVDAYEKAIRRSLLENGKPPANMTVDEVLALFTSLHDQSVEFTQAISIGEDATYGYALPLCLEGDYPATDIFPEDVCAVNRMTMQGYASSSPSAKLVIEVVYTKANRVLSHLSPYYVSDAPKTYSAGLTMHAAAQGSMAFTDAEGNVSTRSVSITTDYGVRGITYTGGVDQQAAPGLIFGLNSGDVAEIAYFAEGDVLCGRGQKETIAVGEMARAMQDEIVAMRQAYIDQGGNPAELPSYEFNLDSQGQLLTRCTVTIN